MARDEGWQRRFEGGPIMLPDGRKLITLRDAGNYIASLPKKESAQPHWQTAIRELMISAERKGILLLSEWAMKKALAHGKPEPSQPPRRRKPARRYRIVR